MECTVVLGYPGARGGVFGVSEEEPLVNETFLQFIVHHTQIKLWIKSHTH